MNSPAQAAEIQAIRLSGVSKSYRKGSEVVHALRDASLEIGARGMVAIVGPSGSGKSTLLHLMGGMDEPTQGDLVVAGQTVSRLTQQELTRFRRQTVGFVFQTFNLIPNLTALENVALPMEFNGVAKAERLARATALLQRFNLGQRLEHRSTGRKSFPLSMCDNCSNVEKQLAGVNALAADLFSGNLMLHDDAPPTQQPDDPSGRTDSSD